MRIINCKNIQIYFTAVKHIFRIFNGVLPEFFLLNSANTQNNSESLSNCKAKIKKREICI
jgi:hypothetical protein